MAASADLPVVQDAQSPSQKQPFVHRGRSLLPKSDLGGKRTLEVQARATGGSKRTLVSERSTSKSSASERAAGH
jgi:hypothetical protein